MIWPPYQRLKIMAQDLKLSMLFGGDYDRVRPLRDGLIKTEGVDLKISVTDSPSKAFTMLSRTDEFDGGEMSLSFFSTLLSRHGNKSQFIGFPVYPSRMFRHGNLAYNINSGIKSPRDLNGKVMGLPEYGMTMAVWLRGLLTHEYGVDTNSIKWRAGRDPAAIDPADLLYPKGVDIRRGGDSPRLMQMLNDGELDAVIAPLPEKLPPNVARFFPDYAAAEQAYYKKTSIFPIMHVLVLKRKIFEANPWLARPLYDAFCRAKEKAIANLWFGGVLAVTLPWLLPALEEQTKIMGGDLWSYGLQRNRPTLEAYLTYAEEQGLLWRKLAFDELFIDVGE